MISVFSLYLDFFKFLDLVSEDDPWPLYQRLYLQPHEEFLMAYWRNYDHFDLDQIAARVRQIKKADYAQLQDLIQRQNPSILAAEALNRCQAIFPREPQPPVYLFVGFFSADGVTVKVGGAQVIALGLERFRDFQDFPLLVSHEYGHFAWRSLLKDRPAQGPPTLFSKVISEGISVFFSQLVYPEIPLHRHLFLTPERLRWCRENQEALLDLAGADLAAPKLIPILFGPGDPDAGIPPRVGYFLARQMLGHCLAHHGSVILAENFPGSEILFRKILEGGILRRESQEEQAPS
ncbi:MAG TPA: DUF2268 domain-containing putative Zn-dependent protease [Thermodesulfobacteriota bacterium]|nr:DUF2268 domain-containing putative Zn-dependent protease [Thermodesulfobacteriota bacterium]